MGLFSRYEDGSLLGRSLLSGGAGDQDIDGQGNDETDAQTDGLTDAQAEQEQEKPEEHYDGNTVRDVFDDYDKVRFGGEPTKVNFIEARKYLQQVRDQNRRIFLLKSRIRYHEEAEVDSYALKKELEEAENELKLIIAEISDEISKLADVNQELVMTKRYIENMSWDDIARTLDFRMRTVQKCHGKALPRMQQILLDEGLITLEDNDGEGEDE